MSKKNLTQPLNPRPPIVTILGHVDHGKTSLLDYLRKTHIQEKEAGGITQNISAYQLKHQNRLITFVDTPGHAAFAQMRRQGGSVADIAILIIAADDGVMSQTKESLKLLQDSKTPFLVAINKIDLPGSNPLKIKTQLSELGVYVEGFGGNTPIVEISVKTGQNIDVLLETLLLIADLEELSDNSSKPAQAVVLEAYLDSAQGPTAALIIKSGTFHTQDRLFIGPKPVGKIRSMRNFSNTTINKTSPSTPVQIIGFSNLPQTGDIISSAPRVTKTSTTTTGKQDIKDKTLLNIILKTDVLGSLQAIKSSLPQEVSLIESGTGSVTETDIDLAQNRNAQIITFNLKTSASIKKLAKIEKIKISQFNIIYELLDYLQELIDAKLEQIKKIPQETASLEVLKVFNVNQQKILGCLVLSGKLHKNDTVAGSQIISLKVGKNDTDIVKKDQQCGILLKPELDAKAHDILKSHN